MMTILHHSIRFAPRLTQALALLVILAAPPVTQAQTGVDEVLFFPGRPDQTGTANGGAVLLPLETGTWRFWFRDVDYAFVSPDSSRVVYAFRNIYHTADFSGQNARAWPALGHVDYTRITHATWSPLGDRLAFFSVQPESVESDLNIVSPTGALLFRHRLGLGVSHTPPTWSPDGSSIAFVRSFPYEISVINVESGAATRVFSDSNQEFKPYLLNWSPDGRHLGVVREQCRLCPPFGDKTVDYGIALIPSGGGEPAWVTKWTVQLTAEGVRTGYPGDIETLAWSPQGDRMAYSLRPGQDGNQSAGIYIVGISNGGNPAPGAPVRLSGFVPASRNLFPAHLQWADLNPGELIVNDSGDGEDADPSPAVIDTDLGKPGHQVTLRAAVVAANAATSPQTIRFDIPGEGEPVISAASPLPTIIKPVTIDATTQPGVGRVHLQGVAGAVARGLEIASSNTKVKGLTLSQFTAAAIHIVGGSSQKVEGCFIGTNSAGAPGLGNGIGIKLTNAFNVAIGGFGESLKNVISGNGVGIEAEGAGRLTISNNLIGTTPDGLGARLNAAFGVVAKSCSELAIGSPEARTLIYAPVGISLQNVGTPAGGIGATIHNVKFNLDASGVASLGNAMNTGVLIANSFNVSVGGETPDTSNTIANALAHGMEVVSSEFVAILSNRIGTSADGLASLPLPGTGIKVDGGRRIQLGSGKAQLMLNAKTGVHIANVLPTLAGDIGVAAKNIAFNLNQTGLATLGNSAETGILVDNSSQVTIGGDSVDECNHFAGLAQVGIFLKNSKLCQVLANSYGFSTDGQFSLPILGTGLRADTCQAMTLGSSHLVSRFNSQIGVIAQRLTQSEGGTGSEIKNFAFNLNAAGTAGLGSFMRTALQLEDSEDVTIGGTTGATGNTLAALVERGILLRKCKRIGALVNRIGTSLDGTISLPVAGTGIHAEECEGLTLGTATHQLLLNAQTGILLKNVKPTTPNGVGASVQNALFNITQGGSAVFGETMTAGLKLEDSERIEIGGLSGGVPNVFSGIKGHAIDMLRCKLISTRFNRIGTSANGLLSLPVTASGIFADTCQGITLGTTEQETLINAPMGVYLKNISQGVGDLANTLQNLTFNLKSNGTEALGTTMETAICVENSSGVSIGGSEAQANVIGQVSQTGIDIVNSELIDVTANKIGTTRDGQTAMPVAGDAISISLTQQSLREVTIMRNQMTAGLTAVNVKSDQQKCLILQNIKSSVEPANSGSFKAIRRASHPESVMISSAERGSTRVEGTVAGRPNATLTLEFFAYPPLSIATAADLYIGSLSVRLDSGGFGSYSRIFSHTAPKGWRLTSTVTNDVEGTSELSAPVTIAPPLDSDGDGLPDAWEILHSGGCLNPFVHNALDQDCDGDALTNLQEYIAGSHPLVPDSPPGSDAPIVREDGGVSLTVPALSGRRYTLQRLLIQGNTTLWVPVTSRFAAASGPLLLIDPITRSDAIYRVVGALE